MTKIYSVEDALWQIRNNPGTLGNLIAKGVVSITDGTPEFADNVPGKVMSLLWNADLTAICQAGPPVPTWDLQRDSERIRAVRKTVISTGLDPAGRPKERSKSEMLAAFKPANDIDRANIQYVIDLMTTPVEDDGYDDLEHTNGKARGAVYCVREHAATEFGYRFAEQRIEKPIKIKGNKPGRARREIVALE